MDQEDHEPLTDLVHCLASRSDTLRTYAAAALPVIGAPAADVVPELTRLLQDRAWGVVDAAADGLRLLAPFATSAVPALVDAIRAQEIEYGSSDALADVCSPSIRLPMYSSARSTRSSPRSANW